MLRDLHKNVVTDIAVAIIQAEDDATIWDAYLLNLKNVTIKNILVTSRGYGKHEGEKKNTSSLRFFFDELPAQSFIKIEGLQEALLGLTSEYWVSFYESGKAYDKKYIFLPDSINNEEFLSEIPLIEKKGSIIK